MRLIRRFIVGIFMALGGALLASCLAMVIVPPFLDRLYYEGQESGHYAGGRFFNPEGVTYQGMNGPRPGPTGLFGRLFAPSNWPANVPVTPLDARALPPLAPGDMRAIWVGHATMLIQAGPYNILTDPIWAERAGPFGITGPRRTTAPGIPIDKLPRVDAIVVSHNHYDHLDLPTLKALWERDRPAIVTGLGNETIIGRTGAQVIARDWGGTVTVKPGLTIRVLRNHHWSSRWLTDRNRALWSAFMIDTPSGKVLFSGDTGFGNGYWIEEARALGPVRLALIPIGAFRFSPGQLANDSHIGPEEAVRMFQRIVPAQAIAMHWGTFKLSDEARESPPGLLRLFMACEGVDPARFIIPTPGVPVKTPADMAQPVRPTRPASDCAAGSPAIAAFP